MKKYLLPPEEGFMDGCPAFHIKRLTIENLSRPNPYVSVWEEHRFSQTAYGLVPAWSHTMCSPVAKFTSLQDALLDLMQHLEDEGYEFLTIEQANRLKVML